MFILPRGLNFVRLSNYDISMRCQGTCTVYPLNSLWYNIIFDNPTICLRPKAKL